MEIRNFHLYNRLVARGFVKPLTCDHCDNPYTLRATETNEPVLQCNWCNSLVQPGLNLYNRVVAVVKEHFDD